VAAILTNPEAASIKFLLIGLFPSVAATDMPAAIPALLVALLPLRFAVFGFPCAGDLSTRTFLFAAHFANSRAHNPSQGGGSNEGLSFLTERCRKRPISFPA
jgi:hypothetical protein